MPIITKPEYSSCWFIFYYFGYFNYRAYFLSKHPLGYTETRTTISDLPVSLYYSPIDDRLQKLGMSMECVFLFDHLYLYLFYSIEKTCQVQFNGVYSIQYTTTTVVYIIFSSIAGVRTRFIWSGISGILKLLAHYYFCIVDYSTSNRKGIP